MKGKKSVAAPKKACGSSTKYAEHAKTHVPVGGKKK